MSATWLVTGSSGFLGSNAGFWLQGRANRVGVTRTIGLHPLLEHENRLDLRDEKALRACILDIAPDVVLHTAAISGHATCAQDPEQAEAVNVGATRTIAECASGLGARLIYVSTDAVFSGDSGNYSEADPVEPFSLYGETKLAGEEIVRELVPDSLIVRTNFFGWSMPGDKSVLEFFVNSLRAGQPVKGYPDSVVTSIYVRSLIEKIWQLNELGTRGTVHIASRDARSKYEFGVAVAEQFGLDPTLIDAQAANSQDNTTSRGRNLSLNTDLVSSLLGEKMPSQVEGIEQARADENGFRAYLD